MALRRRATAEFIGAALLLAAVVGSGIMGERLSSGNVALALLANSLATGAALTALIMTFGPISGAHFNPAVSIADASQGGLRWCEALIYVLVQFLGAFAGVGVADVIVRGTGVRILHSRSQWIGTGVQRGSRDVWTTRGDLGMFTPKVFGRPVRGCCVHRRRVLVHSLHLLRKSCGDAGAGVYEHVHGDSTAGRPDVLGRSANRCRHGQVAVPMARAVASRVCISSRRAACEGLATDTFGTVQSTHLRDELTRFSRQLRTASRPLTRPSRNQTRPEHPLSAPNVPPRVTVGPTHLSSGPR